MSTKFFHAGGRPTLTLRPQVLARPWSPADARGLTSTAAWSRAKVPLDIFVADELFMDCERRGARTCREVDQGQSCSGMAALDRSKSSPAPLTRAMVRKQLANETPLSPIKKVKDRLRLSDEELM